MTHVSKGRPDGVQSRSGSLSHPLFCLPFVESGPGLGDSALLVTAVKLPVDTWLWGGLAFLMLLLMLCIPRHSGSCPTASTERVQAR